MTTKKLLAGLLAVVMLLSFAACGNEEAEVKDTTPDTTNPAATEPNATEPAETEPGATEPTETEPNATEPAIESEITYFSLTHMDENGGYIGLTAMLPFEGDGVYVEMQATSLKMGNVSASAMDTIYQYVQEVNFAGMNGMESYNDGAAYGDFYIEFANGDIYSGSFSGAMPQEFQVAMGGMIVCFEEITAELGEYVPAPMEMGEIAENDKAAIYEIIEALNPEQPDAFAISGIAKDENFSWAVGLSSDAGIASAVSFAPMNTSVAYSLVIVSLEEGTDAEAIIADFAASIDWLKLVCVMPEQAVIATKDNQILMFAGSADMFTLTVSAIETCGWSVVENLTNPNM